MKWNAKPAERRTYILNACRALAVLSLLMFASERQASAYTDPGSGMLIWQLLVAGFVGSLFYFRKFTSWVRKKTSRRE